MNFPCGDTGELVRLGALFIAAFKDWKLGRQQPPTPSTDRLQQHAREVVWQLQRAYETAAGASFAEEVVRELRRLIPDPEEAKRAFVAWANLLELLIQEAEREHGRERGRGPQKADQVKAVLIHLFVDEPVLHIPDFPDFLVPFIVEIGVNWSIDAIVLLLNRNSLWEPAPGRPAVRVSVLGRLVRAALVVGKWFMRLAPVVRLGALLLRLTRKLVVTAYPLNPEIQQAVRVIECTHGARIEDMLRKNADLIGWIGGHRQQVVALVEVVSFAVQEAEFYKELTGQQKKIYVRELIIAFLEDVGLIQNENGLMFYLADRVLDWVIDAIVSIFNARAESFGQRAKLATS